jgi:hypothetical protein
MRLYTIFNLALTYHQLGERTGNETWMGQSIEYYGSLIHSLSSERDARDGCALLSTKQYGVSPLRSI